LAGSRRSGQCPALPWIVAAPVLYAIALMITMAVHVPLNDAIKAAGVRDPAGARERFDEARWAAFNVVRAVTATAAFGCLAWALAVHGRGTMPA
jgi:uncharacterized membrane protein